MRIKIQNKQNLFDVSIQELGGISRVFDLAVENGLSVTSDLIAGQMLAIDTAVENIDIKRFYSENNIKPATASTAAQNELLNQNCGIGCMIIGTTFIVGKDTPETLEEIRLLTA